jgi:hypothetical protein
VWANGGADRQADARTADADADADVRPAGFNAPLREP